MKKDLEYYSNYSSMHFAKMRWFGIKKYVKYLFGFKPINVIMTSILKWILPKKLLARIPVKRKEVNVKVGNKTFVMLDPMRCSIAKEVYWCDGYRLDECERFALDMFSKLAETADYVFDIGANTGIFSLAAAIVSNNSKVHAFEIVPDVFKMLFDNIIRNDLLTRIVPHCKGVGINDTTVIMPVECKDSALPSSLSTKSGIVNGVNVPICSLDSFVSLVESDTKVLIKIDVEGTEADIFKNASLFLQKCSPDIICEILPWAQDYENVAKILKKNGYSFFKINAQALEFSNEVQPDQHLHDWFFTKSSNLYKDIFPIHE